MFNLVHHHYASLGSTNDWPNEHSFAPDELVVITADEQVQGRGQFGRKWISPAGKNLYVTFCFYVPTGWPDMQYLALIMSQACATVVGRCALTPQIRPPNDVLVHDKKIAGALVEVQGNVVAAGLGLNVNLDHDDVAQIDQPATSLLIETGKVWDKRDLLQQLTDLVRQDLERRLNRDGP